MNNIFIIALSLLFVWSLVLSFIVFNYINHYKKLVGKSNGADLKKILEGVRLIEETNKKDIKRILESIDKLERDGATHLQKLGLVRYNPFNDTGGNHSFSLSVLDKIGNGFILTGLHTRERFRFYIKSIKERQATKDKELSNEEKRSLELASKQ